MGLHREEKYVFEGFDEFDVTTTDSSIHGRRGGSRPPVLLLHGFPQIHLMWRSVARVSATKFTVVCADLRGYWHSACPPSDADHAPQLQQRIFLEYSPK